MSTNRQNFPGYLEIGAQSSNKRVIALVVPCFVLDKCKMAERMERRILAMSDVDILLEMQREWPPRRGLLPRLLWLLLRLRLLLCCVVLPSRTPPPTPTPTSPGVEGKEEEVVAAMVEVNICKGVAGEGGEGGEGGEEDWYWFNEWAKDNRCFNSLICSCCTVCRLLLSSFMWSMTLDDISTDADNS